MFDFHNQDVVGDTYLFRKSTYNRESSQATQLRGTGGVYRGGDGLEENMATKALASKSTKQQKQSSKGTQASRYHKVSKGESLYVIARKHGTTVNAICKLNHISQNVRLMPGQILKY